MKNVSKYDMIGRFACQNYVQGGQGVLLFVIHVLIRAVEPRCGLQEAVNVYQVAERAARAKTGQS